VPSKDESKTCGEGERYDTSLEGLPGVNPCVPDDGCGSGQERSPVDDKCYKRGEGPSAPPDQPKKPAPEKSEGCPEGYKSHPYNPDQCVSDKFDVREPDENGECPQPFEGQEYRKRDDGFCYRISPDLIGTSPNDLAEFRYWVLLGTTPTLLKNARKGKASGGLVSKKQVKKKKYQAGGIASLTRDARMGAAVNPMDGYNFGFAGGGMAAMPEYRAGGKLLRGAGDGMSDDIPAVIRGKSVQRAALADGEFVIPADVVSHLGNGSTEAGAKKLYKMMAQIRRARTGKSKQAPRVNTDKYLPR
jgi:hypothetical protein